MTSFYTFTSNIYFENAAQKFYGLFRQGICSSRWKNRYDETVLAVVPVTLLCIDSSYSPYFYLFFCSSLHILKDWSYLRVFCLGTFD